jgi:AraC-like DNA-binding protein
MMVAVDEVGLSSSELLAKLGVDPRVLDDKDARIRITTLHAAWELALALAPIVDGAITAPRYAPGDYGLAGFVAMNSTTLGEAIGHVVRYVGLWTDDPGMTLDDDGTVRIVYRHPFVDGPGLRAATEAGPVELLHGARLLLQSPIVPREVRYPHPPPSYRARYDELFACPVRFSTGECAIAFDRGDLGLPLPHADAQLGAFLRQMANEALEKRRGPDASPLGRVREIIAEELARGVPAIDVVAKRMATSERTLRRRLEESGSSFRDLLDDTRAELARSYVRDARMPLSEVAFMLGFSEPSTFHRAFKRWTGTTPAAFRAKALRRPSLETARVGVITSLSRSARSRTRLRASPSRRSCRTRTPSRRTSECTTPRRRGSSR